MFSEPDALDQIRSLTAGRGVDIVLDNLGGPDTWALSVGSLAVGGTAVTSGAKFGGRVEVDLRSLYTLSQRSLAFARQTTRRRTASGNSSPTIAYDRSSTRSFPSKKPPTPTAASSWPEPQPRCSFRLLVVSQRSFPLHHYKTG